MNSPATTRPETMPATNILRLLPLAAGLAASLLLTALGAVAGEEEEEEEEEDAEGWAGGVLGRAGAEASDRAGRSDKVEPVARHSGAEACSRKAYEWREGSSHQ